LKYRSEIDGLRALAVAPVILFHAGFELFSGGFVGVDVFFVISGYLITTILISEIENRHFSIANFYERRARRILPALFFVMLACLPFAWLWMIPSQMKDFSESLVAVSLFASNILFWRESGYFDAVAEEKPLLHTWSLAVEEQYYLLFPIFLMLAWRFGKDKVFWMLIIMTSMSFLLSELGWRYNATANFYLAPTRAWELFSGSIAAFIVQKRGVEKGNFLSLIGLCLVIASIITYDQTIPFPSIYTLVPVGGVVLLILYADKDTIAAKILSTRVLVSLGLISYSAYLWHQPLFAFARIKLIDEPPEALMLSLSIISIALAYFSWKFIEKPFRNTSKVNQKSIFLGSITGLIGFISIGYYSVLNNQFDHLRFPGKPMLSEIYSDQDAAWSSKVRTDKNRVCEKLGLSQLSEEVCFTNSEKPTLLIIGDSKAMALSSGIFSGYLNIPTVLISAHACPIYPNLTYTPNFETDWDNNCTAISKKIYDINKAIPSIDTVIIANHAVRSDNDISRYFKNEKQITNSEAMITGFGYLIEKMLVEKNRVIFLTDVPKLKNDSIACLYRDDLINSDCNANRNEVFEERQEYYENIKYLSDEFDFRVVDSLDIFCAEEICKSYEDGALLYYDKTHLTPRGADMVLREIFRQ